MKNTVLAIREAETLEDAVAIYEAATRPRASSKPPSYEEVMEFAEEYASRSGDDVIFIKKQADEAFNFYEDNMRIMNARTWKDGNGNTVKNWRLKIMNNWFKGR